MTENKRVIKFRGLDVNARTWVYGHYIEGSHGHYIGKPETGERWQIMPDSVGQFTGLTDKNGVEIYEGDVVYKHYGSQIVKDRLKGAKGVVQFGEFILLKDEWGVEHRVTGWHMEFEDKSGYIPIVSEMEVIGNIYQNPDLLTSKQ